MEIWLYSAPFCNWAYLSATVLRSSSLIERLISALCLSMGTFKRCERSWSVFRRSFVNFPCALNTLTTLEYASSSEKQDFDYNFWNDYKLCFLPNSIKSVNWTNRHNSICSFMPIRNFKISIKTRNGNNFAYRIYVPKRLSIAWHCSSVRSKYLGHIFNYVLILLLNNQ